MVCYIYHISSIIEEDICSLPSAEGGPERTCRALFKKFYYNKEAKECQEFTYGGCEGNANRFDTKEACEERCKKD